MSEATDKMIATAKTQASSAAVSIISNAKQSFLDLFGSFVTANDLIALDKLFTQAALAKGLQYAATSKQEADEYADEYDAYMDQIETVGDKYLIVGKAKAGVLIRSVAHQIISGFFAVAGAVLQAGLAVVLPGVGSLVGAAANAGIQHVVAHFLGE